MFSMPQDPLSDKPREGSSDEHPIRLESDVVTVREFERIMFFILGTQYAINTVGTLHRH